MNQLESDLQNDADKRLQRWINDTVMRCDAVDLPGPTTVTIVFSCLLHEVTCSMVRLGMGREDFLIICQQAFDLELRRVKKSGAEAKDRP